uniref:Uncharacterized protein n=1 Tax=Romanomermis culicivorax TaxID=13658 RepID=A0A915L896_ROMCU
MGEQKCEYKNGSLQSGEYFLRLIKISKNPGKRALAKLMLNLFWGKNNMEAKQHG